MNVACPYCDRAAVLVKGNAIYPTRTDLFSRNFWLCAPCGAYVGTHQKNSRLSLTGIEPLGRLANAQLRTAKMKAHAVFDPIWKSGKMTRQEAYSWLAGEIGVSVDNCHIGMFDIDACRAVVAIVSSRYPKAA